MEFEAGQSMAVQFGKLPRVWRFYSPANAPGKGQLLTFHVKVMDGGMLSTALALHAQPGDELKLGPPVGNLKLGGECPRDLLLVAGSTGLAPLLSIVEEVAGRPLPPRIDLFFGAGTPDGLYDLPLLERLERQHSWLNVTHTVMVDPDETTGYQGEHGTVVDVMARSGPWSDRDVYVCGPSAMVRAAAGRLEALGVPQGQVHVEDFGLEG
jgi:NAD(P)H-flavin reductase